MVKFTIPLQPITKKNSQQIIYAKGRPMIIPSKAYRRYEKYALWLISYHDDPIEYPVNVKMVFYMRTRRRVDLVNLQEACLDILVAAGVLADDNCRIVASMDGSRVKYDKDNPRTEVEITPYEEEDEQKEE